jgi:glyceraldehyde-3-phosphate dehydrogenase/erythrose-4-phosphate dehydrogenase
VAIRVGINGFGRVRRLTFRNLVSREREYEVALINDLPEPGMLYTMARAERHDRRMLWLKAVIVACFAIDLIPLVLVKR